MQIKGHVTLSDSEGSLTQRKGALPFLTGKAKPLPRIYPTGTMTRIHADFSLTIREKSAKSAAKALMSRRASRQKRESQKRLNFEQK
jgi:hypothetical protein